MKIETDDKTIQKKGHLNYKDVLKFATVIIIIWGGYTLYEYMGKKEECLKNVIFNPATQTIEAEFGSKQGQAEYYSYSGLGGYGKKFKTQTEAVSQCIRNL